MLKHLNLIHLNEIISSEEAYQAQVLYQSNYLSFEDERFSAINDTFENVRLSIDSPDSVLFAFLVNSTLYIGNPITQTFTDKCITATSMAFSSSGEIVISTGEDIVYIQNELTYRLAYHDGIVFDWRFPDAD